MCELCNAATTKRSYGRALSKLYAVFYELPVAWVRDQKYLSPTFRAGNTTHQPCTSSPLVCFTVQQGWARLTLDCHDAPVHGSATPAYGIAAGVLMTSPETVTAFVPITGTAPPTPDHPPGFYTRWVVTSTRFTPNHSADALLSGVCILTF